MTRSRVNVQGLSVNAKDADIPFIPALCAKPKVLPEHHDFFVLDRHASEHDARLKMGDRHSAAKRPRRIRLELLSQLQANGKIGRAGRDCRRGLD